MVVNYLTEQGIGVDHSEASRLFSYCQMTFTAGRFVGVVLLRFFDPALVLSFFAVACFSFCTSVALLPGWSGPACLFALFFFESISYPCIFTIATKNLGRHTKQGSSLIVQGVGGGAWYPPAQGYLADTVSSRRSYLVPMTGYIVVSSYAIGMVIWQTLHGGFRLWTQEETAETVGLVAGPADLDDRKENSVERDSSDNEKATEARVEQI
jgi:FHS family L-fucose permease-like MFS transporter